MAKKKRGRKKKAKAAEPAVTHRKSGVNAKIAAADRLCKNMLADGRAMLADGRRRMNAGVAQQLAGIKEQGQENARAVAKMDSGTRAIMTSSKQMGAHMRKEAKDLVAKGVQDLNAGVQEINKGVREKQAGNEAQARENKAYTKDFYYG